MLKPKTRRLGRTDLDCDTAAFALLLGRQAVRVAEVGAPVAAADGQDGQLGDDDGGADGGGDFFGGLDAQADVAFRVADDDDGLEARALAGAGLFLDGLDLVRRTGGLVNVFHSFCAKPQTSPGFVAAKKHDLGRAGAMRFLKRR